LSRIALKVDVDTLRGTLQGVPRLLSIFERRQVQATFLFSLGPDHTGWALRRVFRAGFLSKVSRTSVLSHYGLRTLMYGVVLPAPDIGARAADQMRSARRAGHECGIHAWDHVLWHDNVRSRDAHWTRLQMRLAFERYQAIFDEPPSTFGAAGWQMNSAAFEQIDNWGMKYASNARGPRSCIPVVDGVDSKHLELPTSLPTFDELVGVDGADELAAVGKILALTESDSDQVFTLHAELEGGLFAQAFDSLLSGWQLQGHELVDLSTASGRIERNSVPHLPVTWGTVPGRSGELIVFS
jgi:undecaprenyl phosphate-alpha-L-ara4FN deformylase